MISKEEVQRVAKLARLGLTEEEVEKFQKELSSILDYIEKLKEVDITGVEPTRHSVLVENATRKDEGKESSTGSQKFLALAPETKDGYFKVKSIL